ncbi:sigma-70 family RNA polymerase sigma factor [Lysobacter sp. CAU 1642]|uniref:RNA polymerase sigma factor n=1 Tax=Pseudomarimonas salicorniae TaxID=2933270 RepID=A0ABT0GDM6_9GAMM|nr:sigma-70 family RNA polymerase sigma factor [Lysobacter sp. CAU 1642]
MSAPADTLEAFDEAAAVGRAARGDRRAFEQLYRRHVGRVYGAIWRLVGGHHARAEELTQEAFIKAWQALPDFRGEAAFGTWLYRVAVNAAMMDLRSRSAGEDRETDDAALAQVAAPLTSPGVGLDLDRAVASLPPRARAVLVLYDIEGWTHDEIAGGLGMAVGSSKAQLHRARQLLRQRLEGHRS